VAQSYNNIYIERQSTSFHIRLMDAMCNILLVVLIRTALYVMQVKVPSTELYVMRVQVLLQNQVLCIDHLDSPSDSLFCLFTEV
jgi:hypothetical protein